jgi:hypothetical protein
MLCIKNPSQRVELCRHLHAAHDAVAVLNVQTADNHPDDARAVALCAACYAQTAGAMQRMTRP